MSQCIREGLCCHRDKPSICAWCQEPSHEDFRKQLGATLPCSAGGPWRPGLGDLIGKVATPIARVLGLSCIDPKTKDLRPASPCAKRKAWLNGLGK